jgi:hypothetical protein
MSVSRYANVGQAVWIAPDGRQVPYLRRRLLPAPGAMGTRSLHRVMPGERIDTIANSELGDPTLSWMLADANLGTRPTQLTEPIGRFLIIPLPAGLPGSSSGQ